MKSQLNAIVANAFEHAGFPNDHCAVGPCKRVEWGNFSSSGALPAAKQYSKPPREIAEAVAEHLRQESIFSQVRVDGPGFINLTLTDAFVADNLNTVLNAEHFGVTQIGESTVIDYGGANVAKPLHVGHLRPAIIGEALKRMLRYRGHSVMGDTHLGDWGLPMGMLIHELSLQHPDWPYFDANIVRDYPDGSPVSIDDLEALYPLASKKSKEDEAYLAACQQATSELQAGRPGYHALWHHFIQVSHESLKRDYDRLGTTFDLWLGESDAVEYVEPMLQSMIEQKITEEDAGALIMRLEQPDDKQDIPPIILRKTNGAMLYSTTDLATIVQRMLDFSPSHIIYVVDKRQALHFEQVFRCARKSAICPDSTALTHIPFGTMVGPDGKPFKTRDGGTLKLNDLIEQVTNKALERLNEGGYGADLSPQERTQVATQVGIAALKFGDLNNTLTRDYQFDVDRFVSFEGKTGPYLQYSAVRAQSILSKADHNGEIGTLQSAATPEERTLMLTMIDFANRCEYACDTLEPMVLCEYAFTLASQFSSFYAAVHIMDEPDANRRAHLLSLTAAFRALLTTALDLLGIEVPNKM